MTPRIPKLDTSRIERSRPAGVSAPGSELEAALAFTLNGAGVRGWVREYRFMWCCQHSTSEHEEDGLTEGPSCFECWQEAEAPFTDDGWRHSLHRPRDWRADFAWPAERLLVECDGGIYTEGRHTRGAGYEADCEKQAEAVVAGWRVIRVTDGMVKDGRALDVIERALASRRGS